MTDEIGQSILGKYCRYMCIVKALVEDPYFWNIAMIHLFKK